MKILIVSKRFYPQLGGGETVLWQLSKFLSKKHDLHVITSKYGDSPKYEKIEGVNIHRIIEGKNSMMNDINFSLRLFKMKNYIINFLEKNKIDIIWNVGYSSILPMGFFSKKKEIPSIVYITSFFGKSWFKMVNPILASLYYIMPIFTLMFGYYNYLICPSQKVIDEIKNYIKSETIVIHSPIDIDEIKYAKNSSPTKLRSQLNINDHEKFLLYVGRLSPEKNCLNLIKTLCYLNKDYKLVIVGDGPEMSQIKDLVDKYCFHEKIIILGRKSHSSTLSIIAACDVLILPSKTEVFPTVVLEGLSLDKLVISTNVGGVSEIISENLYIIDTLDDLNNMLEIPLKAINEDFVKRYSVEKISLEIEEVFKSVVSR